MKPPLLMSPSRSDVSISLPIKPKVPKSPPPLKRNLDSADRDVTTRKTNSSLNFAESKLSAETQADSEVQADTTTIHVRSKPPANSSSSPNFLKRMRKIFRLRILILMCFVISNLSWGGKNGFFTASSYIDDGMPDSTKAEPPLRSVEEMDFPKPDERQRQKECGQKFMIFIGSPGVGFDSFEKDLTLLSTSYKMRPYSYALPNISPDKYHNSQGFLPLMEALTTKVTSAPRGFPAYNRTLSNSSAFFLEEYRLGFNSLWMQDKNIIIGSDSFHLVLDKNEKKIDKFIHEFIDLMPWNDERYALSGSNGCATAFILHRSSRIDQVKAAWSTSSSPKETFKKWITARETFNLFDQFTIAEKLHLEGVNVAVIDVDHVAESNHSLVNYVACYILMLDCGMDGHLQKGIDNHTILENAILPKSGKIEVEVDPASLQGVEIILDEYDCCFEFTKIARFYPSTSSLQEKFKKCHCSAPDALDSLRKNAHERMLKLFQQPVSTA